MDDPRGYGFLPLRTELDLFIKSITCQNETSERLLSPSTSTYGFISRLVLVSDIPYTAVWI